MKKGERKFDLQGRRLAFNTTEAELPPSEGIRNFFQNGLHDMIGTSRFPVDETRKGGWFWELFGW